ncbi:MAG: hypothetical protein ACR652_10835 [Methylocystis sp.]|uniref:hypothetical protein n=1 Tax=Methylocystis sp. TaxID=1911079 RepID=UPI003DA3992F
MDTSPNPQTPPETLKGDILRGVDAIAEFLDQTPRATYHQLSKGLIPGAFKRGSMWEARRSTILAGLRRLEQGAA